MNVASRFQPVVARTHTIHATIEPVAYDCVKVIFVRFGSAVLFSEFDEIPIRVGDVVLLAANTLCGSEPEGSITVTTLYLDCDYIIDQMFWQHAALLADRWDAQDFAGELYSEPAQVLRLGEASTGLLTPWLDELVTLSLNGPAPERFYRLQALLCFLLDVVTPHMKTTPGRRTLTRRKGLRPGLPRHRRFAPIRSEARAVAELFRTAPAQRWNLQELSTAVHLSSSQLGRVFVDAYGKTPMTYLTMLRARWLARLLRETDLSIEAAMREVGWHSRGHAARLFRLSIGVTPTRYRQLSRQPGTPPRDCPPGGWRRQSPGSRTQRIAQACTSPG